MILFLPVILLPSSKPRRDAARTRRGSAPARIGKARSSYPARLRCRATNTRRHRFVPDSSSAHRFTAGAVVGPFNPCELLSSAWFSHLLAVMHAAAIPLLLHFGAAERGKVLEQTGHRIVRRSVWK